MLDLNKAGMAAYKRPREEIIGQTDRGPQSGPAARPHGAGLGNAQPRRNLRRSKSPTCAPTARASRSKCIRRGSIDDGQTRVVAVARDLSGRHEAELRYRELMEVIDKGIVVQDAEGRVTYANRRGDADVRRQRRRRASTANCAPRALAASSTSTAMQMPTRTTAGDPRAAHRQDRRKHACCGFVQPRPPAADLAVGHLGAAVRAGQRSSRSRCCRCSPTSPRSSATARCSIARRRWRTSAAGSGTPAATTSTSPTKRSASSASAQPPADDGRHARLPARTRSQAPAHGAGRSAVAYGGGFDLELQGIRADGHPFWVRVIGEAEAGDPASTRLTGTLQDITQRKQAEETLRVQARTDPLTGLINRDAVLGELDDAPDRSAQAQLAVLYIDLDRFKVVNDVLGHAAGDELLTAAARAHPARGRHRRPDRALRRRRVPGRLRHRRRSRAARTPGRPRSSMRSATASASASEEFTHHRQHRHRARARARRSRRRR